MPKSAVIFFEIADREQETKLKRLALLFDTILVEQFAFLSEKHITPILNNSSEDSVRIIQTMDWLIDKGVIETYSIKKSDLDYLCPDENLIKDIFEVDRQIKRKLIPSEENTKDNDASEFRFAGVLEMTKDLKENMEDINTRIRALHLSLKDNCKEFTPILNSLNTYTKGNVQDLATLFVLDKIPVPNSQISWEQILDFRSDEGVKRKYYALINWINEMSRSDMKLSHIADKYNQLYSEYVKQYSLHKIKSNFTKVELLILGGVDFFNSLMTQNYVSAFKDLISVGKHQINLLEQEKHIEGKELAYIYAAKESFL